MTHTTRPDLLYLVHRFPYPPDKGDRIRSFNVLRYLSPRFRVHVACLADEPIPAGHAEQLACHCESLTIAPLIGMRRWIRGLRSLALGASVTEGAFWSGTLAQAVRRKAVDVPLHAVLLSASSMAPYLRLPELRRLPVVVDLVDVDSQKWLDYATTGRFPKTWLYQAEGRRVRRLESRLAATSRAVALVSPAEVNLFRTFSAEGDVRAIPNGVDLEYFRPEDATEEPACVFVGALDYRPNIDGCRWFVSQVWPRIHRQKPQTRLYLVGRRPDPSVLELGKTAGVTVVGQVPDVRPYVAKAAVSVVPLRIARGVQNKVLESLAMAKAVVASPQAVEGTGASGGLHLLTANSSDEWVEQVLGLLGDPARRAALGKEGRHLVEQTRCWDHCLEPFDALLRTP